mgnify:CR=1 FL=1
MARLTAQSAAVAPGAGGAALCLEMLGVAKVDQRVEPGDGFKDDVAALAAIAAVGAAIFDIFFAAKTDSPGATGTGADVDFRLI